MSLIIYPMVEGDLGINTKNTFVGRFDDVTANLTPTIMQETTIRVGDSLYLTDSANVTGMYTIGSGFLLIGANFAGKVEIGDVAGGTTATVFGDRFVSAVKTNPSSTTSEVIITLSGMLDTNYSVSALLSSPTAAEAESTNDLNILAIHDITQNSFTLRLEETSSTAQNVTAHITITPFSL